jgi:Flp pilus assembly protein TadG
MHVEKTALRQMCKVKSSSSGVALIELVITLVPLIILIWGMLEFAEFMGHYLVVTDALHESARFVASQPDNCSTQARTRFNQELDKMGEQHDIAILSGSRTPLTASINGLVLTARMGIPCRLCRFFFSTVNQRVILSKSVIYPLEPVSSCTSWSE